MSKQEDYFVKLNELVKLKFGDVEVGDFFFNKNKKGEIKATATIIKDEKPHDVEFKVFEDGSYNIISGDTELMDLFTKILTEVLVPHITKCAKEMNDIFNKIFEPIFGKKKKEEPEVVNDFALIYDSKNNKILFVYFVLGWLLIDSATSLMGINMFLPIMIMSLLYRLGTNNSLIKYDSFKYNNSSL